MHVGSSVWMHVIASIHPARLHGVDHADMADLLDPISRASERNPGSGFVWLSVRGLVQRLPRHSLRHVNSCISRD